MASDPAHDYGHHAVPLCQIAEELTESASRAVREGTWDELVWELVGFDD